MIALAPVGLLIAAVGWALLEAAPAMATVAWAIMAAGAALLVVAVVADRRRIAAAGASHRGRSGVSAVIGATFVVAIVLLVNATVARLDLRVDVTELGRFTLSEQTRSMLGSLDEPVTALAFMPPAAPEGTFAVNLLDEYVRLSDRIAVERVDPDLSPDRARRYDIGGELARTGAIVFVGAHGYRTVTASRLSTEAENAFTAAIMEVTGTRQRRIYVLVGADDGEISGFSGAVALLRADLYAVLPLSPGEDVPDDAAAVVVAGPLAVPGEQEQIALQRYVAEGGHLLVLLDPDTAEDLAPLLGGWVDVRDGFVMDPASHVAPLPHVPLVPAVRSAFEVADAYFPGVAAVRPNGREGAAALPLAWTSGESWLSPDLVSRAGDDVARSVHALGAVVDVGGGRAVVIGDSDFATDRHIEAAGNAALLRTAMAWLTEGETVVTIERKVLPNRRLILTAREADFFNVAGIAALPVLMLVAAGFALWRRRSL